MQRFLKEFSYKDRHLSSLNKLLKIYDIKLAQSSENPEVVKDVVGGLLEISVGQRWRWAGSALV